jgi:acyl carrier protein
MSRAASNAAPAAPATEQELAALVVEVLNLDTPPGELDPLAPLYGDQGLGLDSIDILEMAVAISRRYGFQIRSDDPDNERIFASLRALAAHVAAKRTK